MSLEKNIGVVNRCTQLEKKWGGGRCPSSLERSRFSDRLVLGSNPAGATSLQNFGGNSIYPTLPVSFGGYTIEAVGPLNSIWCLWK